MKWDKPDGAVQHTADKRYFIMEANSQQWVAYAKAFGAGTELGVKPTDEEARQVCEDHDRLLIAARQTA